MNDELSKLIDKYNFPLSDTEKDCLIGYIREYWSMIEYEKYEHLTDFQQIAELIRFLRSCQESNIELKSTITNPHEGERKGEQANCCINDSRLLHSIEQHLNTFLEREQFGIWQDSADIKCSNEPFSDESLIRIIEEEKLRKSMEYNGNSEIGRYCSCLLRAIEESQTIPENTTKTKIYSFIYDIISLYGVETNSEKGFKGNIGKGFKGTVGKEKYQYVRNCLNAVKARSQKNWNRLV